MPVVVAAQEGILDRETYEAATGFVAAEVVAPGPAVTATVAGPAASVDGAIVDADHDLSPAGGQV